MDDDYFSTLSNEISSTQCDGFSIGGKTQPSIQSFGMTSSQTILSKQRFQKRHARQSSLLDEVSSEATESQHPSLASEQQRSQPISQQFSPTSRQSWMSQQSQTSNQDYVSQQQQDDDDEEEESCWAGSIHGSIAQTASTQSNTPDKLQAVPLNTNQQHQYQYKSGWNGNAIQTSRTDRKHRDLGPSWSGSLEQNSSASSTTSSVALVRQKWRARRRMELRNAKFDIEEDWCTEGENVDWPGAAPRSRVLPTTILEEEDEGMDMPQSTTAKAPPKKSWGVSSFFTCGCN
eukprot:scaffold3980_cov168-Amphora_coffeaeformis.AAC.1